MPSQWKSACNVVVMYVIVSGKRLLRPRLPLRKPFHVNIHKKCRKPTVLDSGFESPTLKYCVTQFYCLSRWIRFRFHPADRHQQQSGFVHAAFVGQLSFSSHRRTAGEKPWGKSFINHFHAKTFSFVLKKSFPPRTAENELSTAAPSSGKPLETSFSSFPIQREVVSTCFNQHFAIIARTCTRSHTIISLVNSEEKYGWAKSFCWKLFRNNFFHRRAKYFMKFRTTLTVESGRGKRHYVCRERIYEYVFAETFSAKLFSTLALHISIVNCSRSPHRCYHLEELLHLLTFLYKQHISNEDVKLCRGKTAAW